MGEIAEVIDWLRRRLAKVPQHALHIPELIVSPPPPFILQYFTTSNCRNYLGASKNCKDSSLSLYSKDDGTGVTQVSAKYLLMKKNRYENMQS